MQIGIFGLLMENTTLNSRKKRAEEEKDGGTKVPVSGTAVVYHNRRNVHY